MVTQIFYPQWTNQNLEPDFNDLWCTFFVDDSTGWIVGSGGFIKKTTNAGNEWVAKNSGTTLILKAVQFVDQNTGWICGESGLILKTTDGGTNWYPLTSGTTEHLSDIHFYDADTGYVVGFNGTILKTTDSGSSWISLSSGTTNDLYSMDFVDAFIGYAAGEVNDTSSVLKTTDGGASWIDKSSGFPRTNGNCLAVEFINANTGFIGGSGSGGFFYKTTDGGDTWGQSDSPFALERKEIDTEKQLDIYPSGAGIKSIYFKDANNGWRVHWSGTDNSIYGTTDGGITWEMEYRAWDMYYNPLLSVFVTQNGTGLAVGRRGLICLKENTSSDWSRLFSGSMDDIYSIHYIDKNIGWAAGTRWGNPYRATVFKTTNGGKIWVNQMDELSFDMVCVYFINEFIGWSVNSSVGSVWLTTDGGDNWTFPQPIFSFENRQLQFSASLFFIDESIGWYTSPGWSQGWVRKSTDGGKTWVSKSNIGGLSVFFIDQNDGWVVGDNGILKSTDGGENWILKSSLTASYVRFYNANIGMCVGGASVLVSTDGGENWISRIGPSLQTINFINPMVVWGYTSEGTLYKTTNFGNTWETLNTGLGFGETAFFADEYTGWVGGMDGRMFKYSVDPPPPPTPPVWSNQITVENAEETESSQVLTFGQHIDATDSIDASLGEYELPPPPPAGIFDSRYNLPTNPQVSSFIDYRDSTKTEINWTMTFQPSLSVYPMTFTWDSTAFPEGTFYLKDRINGSFVNVNMKNQSSYVLTNPVITSLNIIYKGISSIVDVNNEWNMISVPLIAEDMSLSNLFPSATSLAYGFEGGYVTEDTLVGGKGYWLKFDGNQQVQIYGSRIGDTVPLEIGWNMFGAYEEDIPISQITTTPPGIVATYFFGYNDGYYLADTLNSGQGYWVRVTQNGLLNLNNGGLIKDGEQEQYAEIDKSWGKIIITDNNGKSITLFATEKVTNLSFFELPPMPPTGIFDARYSSGRIVEDISREKIIQISSDNYPITIRAEELNVTIRDMINGELLNEELKNGEELRITNNKITSIEVSGRITGGAPISYELYQNYPNPFNPTTTIKFAIPEESDVNLSIYNVLGELVATIVNGHMKSGYYEYEFEASNLSSGIYLYRISAGNYIVTKKMIVIK
jgi:photosystem II stability/assembly factor-like uncharacterized protein